MKRILPALRAGVLVVALVAASVIAAMIGSASPASAHPHRPAFGVCVTYGTLPLIDADVHYAAAIYTPANGTCATGDTFVPVGRGPR